MIRQKITSIVLVMFAAVLASATILPFATAYAADSQCGDKYFLGIPAWYNGEVEQTPNGCQVKKINNNDPDSLKKFAVRVALNVIAAGFVIAGFVAVFFIIKGGFSYMTSGGDPNGISAAKKSITNAIVGLIICIFAAAIVTAIAKAIG